MSYKLAQEKGNGEVIKLSLGVPEVDAYLKFLKNRCRRNTWISYGYDLQIFLNTITKPLGEVTSMDILTFIESQRAMLQSLEQNLRSPITQTKVLPTGRSREDWQLYTVSTNTCEFFRVYPSKIIRCLKA